MDSDSADKLMFLGVFIGFVLSISLIITIALPTYFVKWFEDNIYYSSGYIGETPTRLVLFILSIIGSSLLGLMLCFYKISLFIIFIISIGIGLRYLTEKYKLNIIVKSNNQDD